MDTTGIPEWQVGFFFTFAPINQCVPWALNVTEGLSRQTLGGEN